MAQSQPANQSQGATQSQSQPMGGGQSQGNPGLSDVAYDIVTLMSNCGDAVEALSDYVEDARNASDQDVARIFEQIRQDEIRHCQMLRDALSNLVKQNRF